MAERKPQNSKWMAVFLTVCFGVLLLILLVMLIVRYRAVESELDRMLVESLTVHTQEAGGTSQNLIDSAALALEGAGQLVETDARALEQSWVAALLETANLGNLDFTLDYRPVEALQAQSSQEREFLQQVLENRSGVSGLLPGREWESSYILVARAVTWDGKAAGVLFTRLGAGALTCEGQHSSLFHTVQSVVAGEDGRIVFGSLAESNGLSLFDMGTQAGISDKEREAFAAAYESAETGSFCCDLIKGGRSYIAWASMGYNNWRVVQFSQSPNVNIERGAMLQAAVMLVSMGVCAVLATLMWWQRVRMAKERMRYAVLAEFKDTLLFEYHFEDDSLEFTSNALDTLEIADARMEGVTGENGSLSVFHPEDADNVRRALKNAVNMLPDQVEHDRIRLKGRDGRYRWYRSQYKAVFDAENRPVQVIGTLTDISVQIDREQELREQARQDPLTGLYNRAGVKMINARLKQISRGVLFMMDLDDFKSINDNYGHAAGDKLLTAIGKILTETFRSDDIVARVGGDEFIAFLSGSDSRSTAEQKGQELLERVRKLRIEGIDMPTSVSIGAASAPSCGRSYEALSIVADEALYEVKNRGKSGFILK